jgi:CubicO group peptidase (beta-lactamase class C family)
MGAGLQFRVIASLLVFLIMADHAGAQDAMREKVTAAIPKLDAMAAASIRSGGVPGLAIAVVYRDEVVYLKGFGVREAGEDAAVDPDTVFQLASCSKPISSTVVAAIVSDGAVSWDTLIADIDPTFRLHDPYPTAEVTIRDLFAHRSGLPGDAGNDLEMLGFARNDILHRLRYLGPAGSFRAGYHYSNFGLTEGAIAAARAVGLGWEDAAEEKLFRPLGMMSTSARYSDFVKHPNRASLHVMRGGQWRPLVKRDPDAQSPAGGVSSSARDLSRWVRLELGNGRFEGRQIVKAAG